MDRPAEIDVVMPVWNRETMVGRAIDSILAQSFENFHFIIIDHGSTDGTRKLLDGYALKDSRITVLDGAGMTFCGAINAATSYGTAPFIARMDSDDYSLETRLEEQLKFMIENPEIGISGGKIMFHTEAGENLYFRQCPGTHKAIMLGILNSSPINNVTHMMRREVFENVGGYDERFNVAEDYNFWLHASQKGVKFANLPTRLVDVCAHDGRSTRNFRPVVKYTQIAGVNFLAREYNLGELPGDYKLKRFDRFMIRHLSKMASHEMNFVHTTALEKKVNILITKKFIPEYHGERILKILKNDQE